MPLIYLYLFSALVLIGAYFLYGKYVFRKFQVNNKNITPPHRHRDGVDYVPSKPVVVLAANVHGGERTFRESLLILLREIATPGTPENRLLDDMVIVAVPQINPDGFEATPRPTRGNAWGIDLNRDYMKLEHPSIADWVRNVLHEWNPHVWVDGHNGGQFPYNLKYQCPGHADPDQRITALCDAEIFPRVDARLEDRGYRSFYWSSGNEERWRGGQTQVVEISGDTRYPGHFQSRAEMLCHPRAALPQSRHPGSLRPWLPGHW
jgi:hypothetical protein